MIPLFEPTNGPTTISPVIEPLSIVRFLNSKPGSVHPNIPIDL